MGAREAPRKPHFYRWPELLRPWAASNGPRIRAMAKPRSGPDPHPRRRSEALRIVRLAENCRQVGRAIARVIEGDRLDRLSAADRLLLNNPSRTQRELIPWRRIADLYRL